VAAVAVTDECWDRVRHAWAKYLHLAPRTCSGCAEFKKLTTEFEKNVIAASDNPDEISRLVDEYSANVKALFANPSPSP